MKFLPLAPLFLTLALSFGVRVQALPYQPLPSVARPGPGDTQCKKPEYLQSSLRNEEQGTVTFSYLLDKDGAILDGKIIRSSGFAELDRTALVALAKCAFKTPMV